MRLKYEIFIESQHTLGQMYTYLHNQFYKGILKRYIYIYKEREKKDANIVNLHNNTTNKNENGKIHHPK